MDRDHDLSPDEATRLLLAVSDTLVLKALESLGKYVVRMDRSRPMLLGLTPLYLAHTLWPPTEYVTPGGVVLADAVVAKALRGAWDVVPAVLAAHGCCDVSVDEVVCTLDEYVHDLAVTGTAHSLYGPDGLAYRFESRLGLEVRHDESVSA